VQERPEPLIITKGHSSASIQIFLVVAVFPVPGAPKKIALLSFLVAGLGFPLHGGVSLIA